jgi:type IV pilus assembly protein PilY1
MVNNMNAHARKFGLTTIVAMVMTINANSAMAAVTPLAETPLFVTTAVEPNVFMTLDDSGSMDWELMFPENSGFFSASGGLPIIDGEFKRYWNPAWSSYMYGTNNRDRNIVPPADFTSNSVTWDDNLWVLRNHNMNTLYYNPDTDYSPWPGIDGNGDPLYNDADPNNVLRDPNVPGGDSVDLTVRQDYYDDVQNATISNSYLIPSYFTWTDDDADGVMENSDTHTLVEIDPATTSYPSGRTYEEELQNFANWFQYYRKREFSTKAAIGGVINNANASRMGFMVFNGGFKEYAQTMSDPDNKVDVLTHFYTTDSLPQGTPARRALQSVGNYFTDTSSSAPILSSTDGGECQQNFNILMSDGFWNGYAPSVYNADDSDSGGMTDPDNGRGYDGNQNESNDGGNYEDTRSNTLADVAMYYYEHDLRTTLGDRVPQNVYDRAIHQHLVNYTIGFGLKGSIDPDTFDPLASGFSWPNPLDQEDEDRIDDMLHAAYNSRGLYLSAQNPEQLEASLKAALDNIEERKATSSAVSVTSARLTTNSVVYVSEFNTNHWQGTIYAYPIVEDADGVLSLDVANPINAAESLATQVKGTGYDSRLVLTMDDGASGGSEGIPFRWDSLTDVMKNDLRTNASGSTDSDTIAEARLDFLRGDNSNEGQGYQFRERGILTIGGIELTNVLGDIVHSGPVYVAQPDLNWPDEAPFPTGDESYSNFKSQQEDRDGVIYVGANDGMLHGFAESDMSEVLAYIPSNLFSNSVDDGLHYLTQSNYLHKYYNDLTPTISDVYYSNNWHTVAVVGQRAGGRGYSALDVTDPSLFSEANAANIVMWEFNNDDDPDLGYTFSRPQIGMTNDGEWVAVFGNGYNNDGDGQAKLFIVKIEAGIDGTWSATDYTKITTGVGSLTTPNGLATPALADLDGNGTIDRAYAGDLNGNMWSFDLSGSSSSDWQASGSTELLFTTIGSRPITSQPALSFHPTVSTDSSNEPNVMVAFGTGQYMFDSDKSSTDSNYFYGVWDHGQTSSLTSSDLVEQTYRSGFSARVLTQNPVDYSTYSGWYISLPDSGERVVTNPTIRSGYVFFNTSVPSADACAASGYGYRFVVDLATGGTPDEPVVDYYGDGVVDENDTVGEHNDVPSAKRFERQLTDDTLTEKYILNERDLTAIKDAPTRETGRVSWQELLK